MTFFFNVKKTCRRLGLTDGYSGLMQFDISNTLKTRALVITMLNLVMNNKGEEQTAAIERFNKKHENTGYSVEASISKRGRVKNIIIFAPITPSCPFLVHKFKFKLVR